MTVTIKVVAEQEMRGDERREWMERDMQGRKRWDSRGRGRVGDRQQQPVPLWPVVCGR